MAVRLTVVVAQTASRDSAATNLEETLAAELMMARGLDATMIGPIERVQPEGTDFLCINSFNHSFVLVSWLDTDLVRQHWQRLALTGVVQGEADQDAIQVLPATAKRVLHMQLTAESQVPQLLERIQNILKQRSVQTVNISLGSEPTKKEPVKASKLAAAVDDESRPPPQDRDEFTRGLSPVQDTSRPLRSSSAQMQADESSTFDDESTEDEPSWRHLDELVDDLDALDL